MVKALSLAAAIYLAIVFYLYMNQRRLIYFPDSSLPSPASVGVPEMQVVTLYTEDGLALTAWYQPPTHSHLPTLVYFHGNAGNIGYRGRIVKPFLQEGFGVLLVTYRGYSQNPGKPSEEGLYRDARAAIQFLLDKNVPEKCFALYGESLGTGVAVQMATEYAIGALILQSPFTSLDDVGYFHYPLLPIGWLLKDHFRSIDKVNQIHAPTLILHSQIDHVVPAKFSVQLFEAIPNQKHKEVILNEGHHGPFDSNFAIDFMKKYMKC